MFKNVTPESVGISSKKILDFYKYIDKCGFSTHSVIMARGNNIFSEGYYAPFHKDFKHRLYSVSKSFVGVAVGLAIEDGLLSLDDKFVSFFPDYDDGTQSEYMKAMTIRDMLTMQTCKRYGGVYWFTSGTDDRTEVYFRHEPDPEKVPGTVFDYDSPGSYMLCVIVERLTGKPILEYMREKFLGKIGFSDDAYCIQCPGGHSFADSGIVCTSRDLLAFARFVMNKGEWDGVQLMNREYLEAATSNQVSNTDSGYTSSYDNCGYGYQIWKAFDDSFSFNGMGDQFAICHPKSDFILIINSDNQGNATRKHLLFNYIFENIIPSLGEPLAESEAAFAELCSYTSSLKLNALSGILDCAMAEKVNGVTYRLGENPMNIEYIRLELDGKKGKLCYKNLQGEKELIFGIGYNEFSKFPEANYSDMIATYPCEGNMYDCAASAAWTDDHKFVIRVQIIDNYFGNLSIGLGFKGNEIQVTMHKNAEAFLNEYNGYATGTAQ